MRTTRRSIGVFLLSVTAIVGLAGIQAGMAAGSESAVQVAQPINEKYHLDIAKLFATNCSWCHDAYGMQPGKGPKLAGTAKSKEQVVSQITNGKTGYMPAFKAVLKEEQIQAMAEYTKALPAN